MDLKASKVNPPLGALFVAESTIPGKYSVTWGNETKLKVDSDVTVTTSGTICRYLARQYPTKLYGATIIERTEVDHWLTFANGLQGTPQDLPQAIQQLDAALTNKQYLVGQGLTMADFAVWGSLFLNPNWHNLIADQKASSSLQKWFKLIGGNKAVKTVVEALPAEIKPQVSSLGSQKQKDVGKFVELPGAEMGKVVVRFPPEASGYLHIGHAKAALLNQYYQQMFEGTLIMRFDDTNPAKEKADFEKVILEDLEMLQVKYDKFSHTSDHFDLCLTLGEKMIKEGKAYADDTEPELMKQEREQKKESKRRNASVEENLKIWEEMKKGSEVGQKYCIRAKIDMQSVNGCMRDPTIFRCKDEPHVRTGDKYKVYPTYDFACPIVDSIEGVTHALRTTEYHDRDVQYYWFCDALGLRKPHIYEYARLCMNNTVLSKRKLTWFVEEGHVDGWDDPRMPTVRGVLRRGMTVEGLRQFIVAQGSSRSVVNMGWDKIWSFNKKVVDPIAPRYTAIEKKDAVPVFIAGAKEEAVQAQKHPKDESIGFKTVWTGPKVLIEAADAETLKEGENATFINFGNVMIKKINRKDGKVESVDGEANVENKDYKKTLKLTWLADTPKAPLVPTVAIDFEHLINKPVLDKDEDFKKYIGHQTRFETELLGDPELKNLKKGDIIQLQRKGFFVCDEPWHISPYTSVEHPVVLFSIPDGKEPGPQATAPAAAKKSEEPVKQTAVKAGAAAPSNASDLNDKIVAQGDKIRDLKAKKAEKAVVDAEVKTLLALKAEFKAATGAEWKPGAAPAPAPATPAAPTSAKSADSLNGAITAQGEKIRDLKAKKADKAAVDAEVKILLSLKAEYKAATGSEWKPGAAPAPAPATPAAPTPAKSADSLNAAITAQGEKVRDLKAKKADKATVDAEVKTLLALKADYKAATGSDWKPGAAPAPAPAPTTPAAPTPAKSADSLNAAITAQGEKVRDLKAKKADKATVDAEVKILLSLKAEYKAATGADWKPGAAPAPVQAAAPVQASAPVNQDTADELNTKITVQGDKVRDLKAKKADKSAVDEAVKELLDLKAEYKKVSGVEWKPSPKSEVMAVAQGVPSGAEEELLKKLQQQGDKVREVKVAKAPKEEVDKEVAALLALKKEYKDLTGKDVPASAPARAPTQPAKKEEKKQEPRKVEKKAEDADAARGLKKQTRLGIEARKEENLPEWYSEVITKSELIEYYDVSGCYILRPWAYSIWESIRDFFDAEIKKLGVKNCYFPIFVSRGALEREKQHIEDFAPEVAWVTKSGDSELAEPIAIRPTSETVMYPAYAKWIKSYRDLPLRLNQWNNVVRWEFKHPQPFLRTREFLWQEGHSAFAKREEAVEEVKYILDLYAQVYEDLLAIPVVKGIKTVKEKFAGADYTTTVEAFIPASGRGIQGATSHLLGRNFSKMFDIGFEDPETKKRSFVWQTSWGLTTRTIGVLVMVHADNKGLVLPPRVACTQVIIVPCGMTVETKDEDKKAHYDLCKELEKELKAGGIRVEGDYRENQSPGWKYSHWELKGVPVRIELGPRDIKKNEFVAVRRDTGGKITFARANAAEQVSSLLKTIHDSMLARATAERDQHIVECLDFNQFVDELDKKNLILAPFCGNKECEERIKKESAREEAAEPGAPAMGAKSLCSPYDQPAPITDEMKCVHPECTRKPKQFTLFGRSY